MGMFDWVQRKPAKCPVCGKDIDEFQSKDGFKKLLKVTPEQLIKDAYEVLGETEVQYYGYCDNGCGALYYIYNRQKGKWTEDFLKNEELYEQKD